MKRRTLADFIKPLPIQAEPARDETPRPAAVELLPELRGGEILVNQKGNQYIVHKVRRPKRDTGFQEPLFRLERTIIGNHEWTLDEMQNAGLKLEGLCNGNP
jgi:hypothetical protein